MSHADESVLQKLESASEREWHVVPISSYSGDYQDTG